MDLSETVDPLDAEITELLGHMADRTRDPERRERIIDLVLTLPPSRQWPVEAHEQCHATHEYVRGLRRDLEQRQLEKMYNYSRDELA